MMRAWMIAPLCLLFVAPADARRRTVSPAIVPAGHILFVGAHPDDEVVAAPLLGAMCSEGSATCSFLVLTRGEGGTCGLPVCSPDLGSVREKEMLASAAIFGGTVTQWTLPDVLTEVASAWSPREAVIERIADAIRIEQPKVVITFEPAHGTTCHPAHREIGRLVIDAIARLGPSAPLLYLLETVASLDATAYRFAPGASPGMVFDASPYWRFIVDAATAHQSQFSAEQLSALRSTPVVEQKVWLARAATARTTIVQCD
jgi:LmbE family N-acetylglucosaminyl deacetylase